MLLTAERPFISFKHKLGVIADTDRQLTGLVTEGSNSLLTAKAASSRPSSSASSSSRSVLVPPLHRWRGHRRGLGMRLPHLRPACICNRKRWLTVWGLELELNHTRQSPFIAHLPMYAYVDSSSTYELIMGLCFTYSACSCSLSVTSRHETSKCNCSAAALLLPAGPSQASCLPKREREIAMLQPASKSDHT